MFGGVRGILHGMSTTDTATPQNWREYRRLRVWEMHQQGQRQQAIADALGLTQGAVSQIIARVGAGGVEALRYRKPQGAKPRLTAAQKTDLLDQLRQGATAHGFQGDVWTCERIAQVIIKLYGVQYHPDYIGPLLRQLGWSVQRPIVRATQRDESAIAEWAATDLPALKKSPG
jgi:transposase